MLKMREAQNDSQSYEDLQKQRTEQFKRFIERERDFENNSISEANLNGKYISELKLPTSAIFCLYIVY